MKHLIRKFKERFWREQWNIAVFRGEVADLIEGRVSQKDLQWLFSDHKNGFCADPFLVENNNSTFLFYEEFEYDKQKGRIMVSELLEDADGKIVAEEGEVVFDYDKHVSYPFMFSFNGEMFMLPETSAENEIALFRATKFPVDWVKETVLIPDFAGIDATLHFAKGKWWIFCSDAKNGTNDSLHIFYANDLFGPWQEHKKNPVKTGFKNSRMAGAIFSWEGKTIRAAQNCEETYGKEIVLNEIQTLSEENFREKELFTLNLHKKVEYSEGMHTISASEHFVAIDAKRFLGARKYLDHLNVKRKNLGKKIAQLFQKKSSLAIIRKEKEPT